MFSSCKPIGIKTLGLLKDPIYYKWQWLKGKDSWNPSPIGTVRDKGLNDAEMTFFNFDVSVFVTLAVSNAIR
jgi:hypothetical protein